MRVVQPCTTLISFLINKLNYYIMENPQQVLRNLQCNALNLLTEASYHGNVLKVQFTGGEKYVNGKSTPFRYYEPLPNGPWKEISRNEAIEILRIY